jgi:hypothetical protein
MEDYLTTYSIQTGPFQYDDDWQLHDTEEKALEWITRQKKAHGYRMETWFVAKIIHRDISQINTGG